MNNTSVARGFKYLDRVPDPLVGLLRAQIVQHQHLGGKDLLEEFQLGGLHLRVVAVLDALEQFAIVAEEALDAILQHQPLKHVHGQVDLAHPDRSGEKQPLAGVEHVLLGERGRGLEGAFQRGVNTGEVRHVGVQGTMAVAFEDAGRGDAALFALHFLHSQARKPHCPSALSTRTSPTSSQIAQLSHSFSSIAQPPAGGPVLRPSLFVEKAAACLCSAARR